MEIVSVDLSTLSAGDIDFSALERCRYEPEAVRAALSPLELGAMLGGISLDELMEVLFG